MRRLRIVEAMLFLIAARVAIGVLPFGWLVRLFTIEPTRRPPRDDGGRRAREDVRQAIASAARHLPGASLCFPRAVAAQAMLRRRGLPTTLYYGAAVRPGEGLVAHVWVQHEEEGIVGHEVALQYRVMARYPERGIHDRET